MAENLFEQEYLSNIPNTMVDGLPVSEDVLVEDPLAQSPSVLDVAPQQELSAPIQQDPPGKGKTYDEALNSAILTIPKPSLQTPFARVLKPPSISP